MTTSRFPRSRRRRTSSIAAVDLAFLPLVFFVIISGLNADTGLRLNLDPQFGCGEPPPVQERNVLRVQVNAAGDILVDGRLATLADVSEEVGRHLFNEGRLADYAESPRKAAVSLETEAATPYGAYIAVLDAVRQGYRRVHDAAAQCEGADDYPGYRRLRLATVLADAVYEP